MRALAVIANYGTTNDQYLSRLIQEYRSMSISVDLVVLSNVAKELGPDVTVVHVDLSGKDPWSLPFAHKQIFVDHQNEYDLFVYSEDDTLVLESNLRAFLEISEKLWDDEVPGFIRFEEGPDHSVNYPEVHGHFHWDPASVCERGGLKFAFFTNEHAACYVLTRKQLQSAIRSGGFLVDAHRGKYDFACTASTDPYTQCGFRKLICISRLDDFLIHHLPNKYVGTIFGVTDPELRRQVSLLLSAEEGATNISASFCDTETKLLDGQYSKSYYEEAQKLAAGLIPAGARTVLSIGCGWGATEAYLKQMGFWVTAVPLDGLIAGAPEAMGVEVVTGNLAQVHKQLGGRQFDCILLSNILHLVPDPVKVLKSFREHLEAGGTSIVIVPNVAHLAGFWKRWRRERSLSVLRGHEATGVHIASRWLVQSWLRQAGLRVKAVRAVLGERAQKTARLTLGTLNSLLATEFIAVATRNSDG